MGCSLALAYLAELPVDAERAISDIHNTSLVIAAGLRAVGLSALKRRAEELKRESQQGFSLRPPPWQTFWPESTRSVAQ